MWYKRIVTKPETISYKDKAIAIIIPSGTDVDGIGFFTGPENPFQIGLHHRPKGMILAPHVHKIDHPITINEIQEVLFIQSGSILLTLLTRDGKIIAKRILKTGDGVLLLREGHQIEYLEETRMFEVKQGPYPGHHNAKIYLKKSK
jgi:hypothetical protein